MSPKDFPPSTGPVLTLRAAVEETITRHPSALAALKTAEGFTATARGAGNQDNPQISTPLYIDGTDPLPSFYQNLELFGQPGLRSRAAWADAHASDYNAATERLKLVRATAKAYYSYWMQRRTVYVRGRYIWGLNRMATILQDRTDPSAETDRSRVEVELALAHADLSAARADALSALALLNAAMGRLSDSDIAVPNDPDAPVIDAPDTGYDAMPGIDELVHMSEQRPEILSAKQAAQAAQERYRLAMLNRRPVLQLQAFANPVDVHQTFPITGRAVAVVANFPFLDWGVLGAARMEAKRKSEAAELTVASKRLDIHADVRTAWQAWNSARERRHHLRYQMDDKRGRALAILEKLRQGVVSVDDAVNTSKSLREIALEFIKADGGTQQTTADLWWAAGGELLPPLKTKQDKPGTLP